MGQQSQAVASDWPVCDMAQPAVTCRPTVYLSAAANTISVHIWGIHVVNVLWTVLHDCCGADGHLCSKVVVACQQSDALSMSLATL